MAPLLLQSVSPAPHQEGDQRIDWTGPNGRDVRVVVRAPRLTPQMPRVQVQPPSANQDAAALIEQALTTLRAAGGGTLVLAPGTYRFSRFDRARGCHLCLLDLVDVSIEGPGAGFVFTADGDGVLLTRSRRVRLADIAMRFDLRTSSIGRIVERQGRKQLVLEEGPPVSASDGVRQLVEFDPPSGRWPQGGQRLLFPPGAKDLPVLEAPQTYASPAFSRLDAGRSFTVHHHWYGGAAVKALDVRGPHQNEDITLQGLHILNAPGMAIIGYGVRRGFAVLRSQVGPQGQPCAGLSAEYDAVHVQYVGGDVLVANNRFACMGDDAINVNSPVTPVMERGTDGSAPVLGRYSRFIRHGDRLAVFDTDNRWLATVQADADPVPLGGLDHRVRVEPPLPDARSRLLVRDLEMATNRYALLDNDIGPCACNGILAQAPNGLIRGNRIHGASHAGIKLLSNTGVFQEGTGAVNVRVADNEVRGSGLGPTLRLGRGDWGAISVYGLGPAGLHRAGTNGDLVLTGNRIAGTSQACIAVTSSRRVLIEGNSCADSNQARPGPSLRVLESREVRLLGNVRSGATSGAIEIEASSAGWVLPQRTY